MRQLVYTCCALGLAAATTFGQPRLAAASDVLWLTEEQMDAVTAGSQLAEIKIPDIKIPDVKIPDVEIPNIDIPDIHIPDISIPDIDIPDIDIPDVHIPRDRGKGISVVVVRVHGRTITTSCAGSCRIHVRG